MIRRSVLCFCTCLALVASPLTATAPDADWVLDASAEAPRKKRATKKKRATRKKRATKKKRATRKKRAAKKRRATRKRRARKKRRARRKRKRRARRSNMPKGWQWPPGEAMRAEGKKCQVRLGELGVVWKKGKYTRKVANPIVVPDLVFGAISMAPTFRKGPFVMDCFLALSLTVHSQAMYDAGVRVLRFSSIHQYRKAKSHGKRKRALSRHALGLAVDVYQITMDDGTTLIVENDYAPATSRLRAVEDAVNATRGFRTLLSPKNDPKSHHDHFHFAADMRLQ